MNNINQSQHSADFISDNKKKIWLLKVGEALPSDEGTQRLLRMGLIADELVKSNYNVTWWVSSFDHNKKSFRKINEKKYNINDNYKLIYLNGNGYNKNWSFARIKHYNKEKRDFFKTAKTEELPDIIYAAMPNLDLANAAVKFGRKHNIPVVVDVRDTWPELYVDYAPEKLKPIVKKLIIPFKKQLSWTLKNATGIFATSDLFLEWSLKYAKRAKKEFDDYFYVSYPDTNIEIKDEDIAEWMEKGVSKEDFNVVFFGQFGHAVDLETVMKASLITAKKAPNIKYIICGTGEKLQLYKEMIQDNKNVIFPGWVDRKQICSLSKISKAGLLSYVSNKNFENSMPNKFCEYLALGLVLLIQPNGMMRNLAEKNYCGIHYENEKELAEVLMNLSEKSSEEIVEIKKNSRNLYEEKFRADVVYKKLVEKITYIADNYNK